MYSIIFFRLGYHFYSQVERNECKFILLDIAISSIFIILSYFILFWENITLISLIICFLYVLSTFIPRIVYQKTPIEVIEKSSTKKIYVGIIDFVWIFAMGATLAVVIFLSNQSLFKEEIKTGFGIEYYKIYYDILKFYLEKMVNSIFLIGGVLVACMTILWAGSIWRSKNAEDQLQYKNTTLASLKMVISFIVLGLGVIIWLGIPLINQMNEIQRIFTKFQ